MFHQMVIISLIMFPRLETTVQRCFSNSQLRRISPMAVTVLKIDPVLGIFP